jgi:hypothetical protein
MNDRYQVTPDRNNKTRVDWYYLLRIKIAVPLHNRRRPVSHFFKRGLPLFGKRDMLYLEDAGGFAAEYYYFWLETTKKFTPHDNHRTTPQRHLY